MGNRIIIDRRHPCRLVNLDLRNEKKEGRREGIVYPHRIASQLILPWNVHCTKSAHDSGRTQPVEEEERDLQHRILHTLLVWGLNQGGVSATAFFCNFESFF